MSQPPPPFEKRGLGYTFTPTRADGTGLGIILAAKYLHRSGDGVTAEITLTTTDGLLLDTGTRHNLTSLQTRQSVVKHFISLNLPISSDEWQRVMVTFCASILAAERRPPEMIRVGRLPRATEGQRYLLWPLLAEGKLNGIHGPGGSGKGYVACLCAVCVQLGHEACGLRPKQANVLYLDWEEVDVPIGGTANERIAAVATGLGVPAPEICYIACRRSLRSMAEDVSEIVDREQIGLVIIDSVEMAMGAGGERETYEQRVITLVEAIREMGPVTTLLIDHVNAATAASQREAGQVFHAFGSVFKHNEIRWSWEVAAAQELESTDLEISLLHDKRNNAGRMTPLALIADFSTPGAVGFKRKPLAETSQAGKLEAHYRIQNVLLHGALSFHEIHEALSDIKEDTIRKNLARHSLPGGKLFIHLPDGRWGVASGRSEATTQSAPDVEVPQMFRDSFKDGDEDIDSIPF